MKNAEIPAPSAHEDATAARTVSPARAVVLAVLSESSVFLLAALYFLAMWPVVPALASPRNLSNLAVNMLPLLAVALGQTVVMIAGGIDLSVTSIIAASSVLAAWSMTGVGPDGRTVPAPAAVPAAVASALALGTSIGLWNGIAVAALRMPPFVVTLSTMMIAGGATLWVTHSHNIANLPDAFTAVGYGEVFGIPSFVPIVAALALAIHVLLAYTLLGRWLYATGLNPRAARISGVPVGGVTVAAYAISGLCAAVAALLYTARLETGSPTMGREILLDVVGATVIGGTSLFGGRGKVAWTASGVLLFSLLDNTLNLLGLEYYTIMAIKGTVILAAAGSDVLRSRFLDGA